MGGSYRLRVVVRGYGCKSEAVGESTKGVGGGYGEQKKIFLYISFFIYIFCLT